jgi:hypothetical protein
VARASRGRSEQQDGIARRRLDTIALEGSIDVEELSLPARRKREIPGRPNGSRTHVYVLQGQLLAGPVERVTERADGPDGCIAGPLAAGTPAPPDWQRNPAHLHIAGFRCHSQGSAKPRTRPGDSGTTGATGADRTARPRDDRGAERT